MIKSMVKYVMEFFFRVSKKSPNKTYQFKNELRYYETKIGNYYLPSKIKTDVIINSMKEGKYFELPIIELSKKYIEPNTIALDVGCNFGQMSILFSKLVGENGSVYSIDADDFVFEVMKKNLIANKIKNVIPVFGAVHEKEGIELIFPEQNFERFGAFGSYGIDPKANMGRKVNSFKIDSLKIENKISFMKVDVQGSDLFALRGARNTILKNKMPIIFEFEQQFQDDFGTSFQDYVEFVREINYKFDSVIMDINYLILPK